MPRFNRKQATAALGAVEALLAGGAADLWPEGVANSDMTDARDVLKRMLVSLTPKAARTPKDGK